MAAGDSGSPSETTARPQLPLLGGPGVLLHSVPSSPSSLQAVITSTRYHQLHSAVLKFTVFCRFVTLAWEAPSSPNGPITGYSVFYQQEGSER